MDLFTQPYYNTVNESGDKLTAYTAAAKSQNDLVIAYFKSIPGAKLSPEHVYNGLIARGLISNNVPLTSLRRSFSNLLKAKSLVKLNEKTTSSYGRDTYLYELNKTVVEK